MKLSLAPLTLLFVLTSCANHSTMRGSVVMKVNEREAHVCLGNGEVKVGDPIEAFVNDCKSSFAGESRNGGPSGVKCVKKKIGEGSVMKTLNDHYSIVQFNEGVNFTEGTIVEKQKN